MIELMIVDVNVFSDGTVDEALLTVVVLADDCVVEDDDDCPTPVADEVDGGKSVVLVPLCVTTTPFWS
jgi:hypothetical protein